MAYSLQIFASTKIFDPMLVQRHRLRHAPPVFAADLARACFTPYLAHFEKVDAEARAAIAATHRMTKGKETNQILMLDSRRAQIPRSTRGAMDRHRAFVLLSELQIDRGYLDQFTPKLAPAMLKTAKNNCTVRIG